MVEEEKPEGWIPEEELNKRINPAVELLIEYEDEILLGKRNNKPAKDFFWSPGSIIKDNETPHDAIDRTIEEELGISSEQYSLKEYLSPQRHNWGEYLPTQDESDPNSRDYIVAPVVVSLERVNLDDLDMNEENDEWRLYDRIDNIQEESQYNGPTPEFFVEQMEEAREQGYFEDVNLNR